MTTPEPKYETWLKLVRQLVSNELDATTYEVQTMRLLGPGAYDLFGIDDVLLQTRRQVFHQLFILSYFSS